MAKRPFQILGQRSRNRKMAFSCELRARMTRAEEHLWKHLRRKQWEGLHFRRQVVIAGYIADFYCSQLRLVIEVDGPIHDSQTEWDQHRDAVMRSLGLRVIRVSNGEVLRDAIHAVRRALGEDGGRAARVAPPGPPCEGAGGEEPTPQNAVTESTFGTSTTQRTAAEGQPTDSRRAAKGR